MLVLDLDDTLLRDGLLHFRPQQNSLKQGTTKGIKVVLASGRPTSSMLHYAKELQLANFDSYMISIQWRE